jgi:integrase
MALKIPDTISYEDFIKLANETKNIKNKVCYTLAFYQCLRIAEVVKLKKEDYDPNTKLLHIKQSKGAKDRNIPISPNAVKTIKYLPIGSAKAKDKGIRAFQYALKKDALRILNKNIHPHTLRHSGATYYLNVKKWDIRQVQVFLGHTDIKITQLYTHVNPEALTKLMWEKD